MFATLRARIRFVAAIMLIATALIVYRLVSLQFGIDTGYFAARALSEYRYQVTVRPPRGEIYDRNGVLLATNTLEYEIGMSPVLILDREAAADALSASLGMDRNELLSDMSSPAPYVLLARPAPATTGQALLAQNLDGVSIQPIPRRYYPHGALASHLLGFVSYDGEGYYGIEGYYDEELAGQVGVGDQSRIPFEASRGEGWRDGSTFYLTIDTEIQNLAESTLAQAIRETGATGGTILVYQPATGEILAMANEPRFDPNNFYEQAAELFANPAINEQYEPGSTMKAITLAIGLEEGAITPDSTYEDNGVIEVAGLEVFNWDRLPHGTTSMTDLLGLSLNVGAATVSVQLGPTRFYNGLDQFGFGELTGIDLQGEVPGSLRRPGDADWFEYDLATNSFGQGMAATPLQMVVAYGALANNGLIMQPHLVMMRVDPDGVQTVYEPTVLRRAISEQTAQDMTRLLANALERESSGALIPGYRVAGKTGTAQIPVVGGYDPDATIASFIGYGPVDNPQFVVLVKLDRPVSSEWGSRTAAPVFSYFVRRLVVLMEIPPDSVRLGN